MQQTILSPSTLEEFYSQVILPQFGIKQKHILWQEHRSIGPDSDLHLFLYDEKQKALVFDDYPTTTAESLQEEFYGHKIARMPRGSGNVMVDNNLSSDNEKFTLRFGPLSLPFTYIHNVTGYFQLFHIEPNTQDSLLAQLKARRKSLNRESVLYASLLDIGFEVIALGKINVPWGELAHIAQSAQSIAESHGFYDLANFFFDTVEFGDIHEEGSFEEYLESCKEELDELASEARINPSMTAHDKTILDTYTLPIHTRMVEDPDNSPEYFIELAQELDHLIHTEGLSVFAAANGLSYALDRPQIIASNRLRSAYIAAHQLELPHTLRQHAPREQWDMFYKEIEALPRK